MRWEKNDGEDLRKLVVQKCGVNLTFLALLLSSEISVLFNNDDITSQIRDDLKNSKFTPHFLCGIVIIISVVCTVFAILATFTSWSVVSVLSDANAPALLRSPIGEYACCLPSRLIVASIYSFIVWICLIIYLLIPGILSLIIIAAALILFFEVMRVYSKFGRLIIHTSAMGDNPIFKDTPRDTEEIHYKLTEKALENMRSGTSVTRRYQANSEKAPLTHADECNSTQYSTSSSSHSSEENV